MTPPTPTNPDGQTEPKTASLSALSPQDEAAFDALIDAGLDPDAVAEEHRERARHVATLLGLLDADAPGGRSLRVERAMAGVAESRAPVSEDRLNELSDAATESFVMAGFDAGRVPTSLSSRAHKLAGLGAELTTLGPDSERAIAEGRSARIDAVLGRVAQSEMGDALAFPGAAGGGRGSFRMSDLVAAAAVLLLASAVLFPTLGAFRNERMQAACLVNGQQAAAAFGLYAGDYRESLPMATAGFGSGRSWMQVGTSPERSNSANLFTLVRTGHTGLETLACPGNDRAPTRLVAPDATDWNSLDEVSYSYRIMTPTHATVHALPARAVLMADRSPVILRVARGEAVSPEARSPNHGYRGQHMLRLDGTVEWAEEPVVEGDNIWLPRQIEQMIQTARSRVGLVKGDELPKTADDAFLGP